MKSRTILSVALLILGIAFVVFAARVTFEFNRVAVAGPLVDPNWSAGTEAYLNVAVRLQAWLGGIPLAHSSPADIAKHLSSMVYATFAVGGVLLLCGIAALDTWGKRAQP